MSLLVILRPARGIGFLDVDDGDEVQAVVAADPAVTSGVMTAEIRPLRIAVR
jgi:hypothetical protein